MANTLTICIGDIPITIEGDNLTAAWEIPPSYRSFIGQGKTDVCLRVHMGLPECPEGEEVFACPPIWSLCRENGTSIIKVFHQSSGLERMLILPPGLKKHTRADLYVAKACGPFDGPFYGPVMELLMLHLLAQGRGAIVHACGILYKGKGYLFVGESGAGKSTMARMWDQERGVLVLSDDRTIVRKRRSGFWIYGTPWHGEGRFSSPGKARLERIFFLRHGQVNAVQDVTGIGPVSLLLTCSFLPHWDPQGMSFSLGLFADMTAQVRCQELFFRPDESIIHFMDKIM